MALNRLLLLLVLLAAPVPVVSTAFAANTATEQAIRAALLFNFLKFTEWTTAGANEATLQVCLATSDPAQVAAMEVLGERRIRGKLLSVVSFARNAQCDVIYVDSNRYWKEIHEKQRSPHALTIGGYAGFVADGGMIEISLQESGARFDINLFEVKRAGLRIYPQLLRLARSIKE